jgi:hypothetical protein
MADPALALVWFTIAAAVLLVLFWPRHGLAVRLTRVLRMTERVRIEDALKHSYNEEYSGRSQPGWGVGDLTGDGSTAGQPARDTGVGSFER